MTEFDDYAAPSIKLENLHKKLDLHLLHKEYDSALGVSMKMQAELVKLQDWAWRQCK